MSCEFESGWKCYAGKDVDCPIEFCRAKDKNGTINHGSIDLKEGLYFKGGVNTRPTTPSPPPPRGQGIRELRCVVELKEKKNDT